MRIKTSRIMNSRKSLARLETALSLSVAIVAVVLLCTPPLFGADPSTNQPPARPAPAQKKPRKALSGAELYAIHCNRCHPERYAPERTPVQWQTILLHMRTRANLPAEQAKTILKYLQEDSGK